jgi:NADH-quinone oxidoreductase subunit M
MLNGFVGEYLILLGTYTSRFGLTAGNGWKYAAWASTGVILSACYLLWSYQRVFFGEITVEKNHKLPDASARERFILATMSVVILWMGIGSAFLTHRTAAATDTIRKQMDSQQWYNGAAPSSDIPVTKNVASDTITSLSKGPATAR